MLIIKDEPMKLEELLTMRQMTRKVTPDNDGQEIVLCGFVTNIRNVGKNLKFIILEDRDGDVQLIAKRGEIEENYLELADEITSQSVICVKGIISKSEKSKRGVEVKIKEFHILSRSEPALPSDISGDTHPDLSTRLDWRHLDLRNKRNQTIFMISSDFLKYSREFFEKEGLIEINTSKLIGIPSEGGAEVFEVKYFDKKAFLAQSPQLYKQMAISSGFEKVYEIAPVFRAEKSFTARHVTEFISLDVEVAYWPSLSELINFQESMLVYALTKLKEKWNDKVKELFDVEIGIPPQPIPRITMDQAYEILKEKGLELEKGDDIGTQGEKLLGEVALEKYNSDYLFVTHYYFTQRPFYHMKSEDNAELTLSFDLLYKGAETTTGALREHNYETLVMQAKEKELEIEPLTFYLNFFKYGCPPHGGFGFGPARLIMKLLNLGNIREAIMIPRDTHRLHP